MAPQVVDLIWTFCLDSRLTGGTPHMLAECSWDASVMLSRHELPGQHHSAEHAIQALSKLLRRFRAIACILILTAPETKTKTCYITVDHTSCRQAHVRSYL